tara:strand:+ start:997 stop:1806 length:810 start_codon:yes stop_codon:yes gene_type:complete
MIDFHNHIIPGVDDGAKTIEMSIDMLKEASSQGITEVVSTIHFQHPKMDGKNTNYSFIKNKCNELQEALDANNINIKIHIAAEVFYLPNLTKILDNPLVTIGDGKFMLIEFQTKVLPPNYLSELFKLQKTGITPIIAHPERYFPVQKDCELCLDWMNRGFVMQLDCGSMLGHFGSKCREISMELIRSGCIQLIGSDAHNNRVRNFCLDAAYHEIKGLFGNSIVEKFKYNSSLLLDGKKLEIIGPVNFADNNRTQKPIFNRFIDIIKKGK